MSSAGGYLKTGLKLFNALEEGKPHTSITDWVEVLTSDRYDELSLDGIPELVESVNIQGSSGTTEGARAIRKKLKYGNVHRQLRALVILRAMTENAGKGFQLNWANAELVGRLKDMATDNLLDPKVKKRLFLVFHAWSIQYKDEPRMQQVAKLYSQYGGGGPGARKASVVPSTAPATSPRTSVDAKRSNTTSTASSAPRGGFSDYDEIFGHDWAPAPGKRGPDTYADLAAAKADAEERKRQREARIAIEQREAELERRERELKRKSEMEALTVRRQREAEQEAERRRQAKEALKNAKNQPKRPKFDFEKEKPQVMVSVANAIQSANNLVNSCRHINRENENVTESPRVQENLDKAKAARRVIIRYIQLVNDEEFVGTLIDANEKIVEAIQLYDKLSKPALLDSDSDEEAPPSDQKDIDALTKRIQAQKLEADRTGELQRMQERQKRESAKREQRRLQRQESQVRPSRGHPDLADLDFGSISKDKSSSRLPEPLNPDSDEDSNGRGLSDFSDYDYNSSDEEWRASHSRRPSMAAPKGKGHSRSGSKSQAYASLEDDGPAKKGLLDPNDPFGDPFADDNDTPVGEKQRMTWTEI